MSSSESWTSNKVSDDGFSPGVGYAEGRAFVLPAGTAVDERDPHLAGAVDDDVEEVSKVPATDHAAGAYPQGVVRRIVYRAAKEARVALQRVLRDDDVSVPGRLR